MGRRWTKQEEEQIAEVRRRLHKELSECPPFPEGEKEMYAYTSLQTNI
jgi:hypothetical protein